MLLENDLNKRDEQSSSYIIEENIKAQIYEFLDTLIKIKSIENVTSVHFTKRLSDIYVVTKKEDLDINEKIIKLFTQWESTYKIFPELHMISEDELFYIPQGAKSI